MSSDAERSRNGRPLDTHERDCGAEEQLHFYHVIGMRSLCPDCGCCWGCDPDCCAEWYCPNGDCGCSRAARMLEYCRPDGPCKVE